MAQVIGLRSGAAVGAMALSFLYSGAASAQTGQAPTPQAEATTPAPTTPNVANPTIATPGAPSSDIAAGQSLQAAPPANTQDASSGDIVVTGYRASLKSASDIKRTSDSILDAVVAEDIGKLPNNTAAETIARMPGVQVDRSLDEVTGVLIRGLPDVTTTYNGRDIFTTDGRGVNLTDFPAGALSGIEVYKSGTADLLEPGLSGLVNVRSAKPFDFKGFTVGGGYRGI